MKKSIFVSLALSLLTLGSLSACGNSSKTITVAASELPHAKILNECLKDIVKEDGYDLQVSVLDWKIQNDAVAHDEYDANYFQHVPYLKQYSGTTPLYAACKVHYEKLCLYAAKTDNMTLDNGESIEIVDDVSNIERALNLLVSQNVLSINAADYVNGEFKNFDTTHPEQGITWADAYKNCTLKCINESQLCQALPDYNFGIIPGNTALTGLGSDYASRIVFGENPTEEMVSAKANIIAVKQANKDSDKTKELVKAFQDARVSSYISKTFGDSVIYHFENGLTTNFLA